MIPFRRNHAQAFERIRTMNALPGSPLRPATRWASSQSGTCMEASARSSKVLVSGGCRSVGDISPSKALLSRARAPSAIASEPRTEPTPQDQEKAHAHSERGPERRGDGQIPYPGLEVEPVERDEKRGQDREPDDEGRDHEIRLASVYAFPWASNASRDIPRAVERLPISMPWISSWRAIDGPGIGPRNAEGPWDRAKRVARRKRARTRSAAGPLPTTETTRATTRNHPIGVARSRPDRTVPWSVIRVRKETADSASNRPTRESASGVTAIPPWRRSAASASRT